MMDRRLQVFSQFGDGCVMCCCVRFLVAAENNSYWCYKVWYILKVQYNMALRNRSFEGTYDGQITLGGYSNLNSYVSMCLVFWMDR
jgi:hypothetical protein